MSVRIGMTAWRALPLQVCVLALGLGAPAWTLPLRAQTPAASTTAAPRQNGTIKAVTPANFVLATAGGQDLAVTVPAGTRILLVPPGSKDLSAAQPGTMSDLAAGDRTVVTGTAGDSGLTLTATRILVMKSGAIAANRQAEQTAWARGVGGIVRTVDPAANTVTVSSGMHTVVIQTTPATLVRRYAGTSVRFEDAVKSNLAAIHPGDQLRARGQRSPDGATLTADEIVTGSFSNYSGVISAIDVAAGTLTLKDLASKRVITVAVTPSTDLRRLPPGMAQGIAARATGGEAAAHAGAQPGSPNTPTPVPATGSASPVAAHAGMPGHGGAGADLSRMLNRMPTETLAGLKTGDAVMIVASDSQQSGQASAITLLAGVEPILAAHPAGETTLSPWTIGSPDVQAAGEGGAPQP